MNRAALPDLMPGSPKSPTSWRDNLEREDGMQPKGGPQAKKKNSRPRTFNAKSTGRMVQKGSYFNKKWVNSGGKRDFWHSFDTIVHPSKTLKMSSLTLNFDPVRHMDWLVVLGGHLTGGVIRQRVKKGWRNPGSPSPRMAPITPSGALHRKFKAI